MKKQKHTSEHWAIRQLFDKPIKVKSGDYEWLHNENAIVDDKGRIIATVQYMTDTPNMGWGHNETIEKWQANTNRIVDCVNALAGIDDVFEFVKQAKKLMKL